MELVFIPKIQEKTVFRNVPLTSQLILCRAATLRYRTPEVTACVVMWPINQSTLLLQFLHNYKRVHFSYAYILSSGKLSILDDHQPVICEFNLLQLLINLTRPLQFKIDDFNSIQLFIVDLITPL